MELKRGVNADMLDHLRGHFHPVMLFASDWPTDTIRVHSGRGSITWGDTVWSGLGHFVAFSGPEDSMGGIAAPDTAIRVAATLEAALTETTRKPRNAVVTVYMGLLESAGSNVLVSDPIQIFTGYVDSGTLGLRREAEFDLTHDLLYGLGTGPPARVNATVVHTYEDQISKFPGDTAGRQVQHAGKILVNPSLW